MAEPEYSYSHDPSASDLDMVRWLIGDTDPDAKTEWQLTNQEIEAAIALAGSAASAAVACAESIAARYARRVTKTSSGTLNQTHALSTLYDHYMDLAHRLRSRLASGAAPLVGGISQARKETVVGDSDRVVPAFDGSKQFQNV